MTALAIILVFLGICAALTLSHRDKELTGALVALACGVGAAAVGGVGAAFVGIALYIVMWVGSMMIDQLKKEWS